MPFPPPPRLRAARHVAGWHWVNALWVHLHIGYRITDINRICVYIAKAGCLCICIHMYIYIYMDMLHVYIHPYWVYELVWSASHQFSSRNLADQNTSWHPVCMHACMHAGM